MENKLKIVVANQAEKELLKRFVKGMSDLSIYDEFHKIDVECLEEKCYFPDCRELDILEGAFNDAMIEVDESESDIYLEENSIITGTCRFCKVGTTGMENDDDISYTDYLKMMSQEEQEKWACSECFRLICSCCGENLVDDQDDNDCAECMKEESEKEKNA